MLENTIKDHYSAPGLLARIEAGLTSTGKSLTALTVDDLAPADEFHVRGAAATNELIQLLAPTPAMHILDLGSGLGGPARRLALSTGCRVTGIDLSADYCATGRALSGRCGLADRVTLQQGNVTDLSTFADQSFDGAWTIHVGMNIAEKGRFYREVARVLKPGAPFVLYDVFTTDNQVIEFPVPWARRAEESFLVTTDEAQQRLQQAGFDQIARHDRTAEGIHFLQQSTNNARQQAAPPPLGLHLVMGPIFREMIGSLYRNFREGRVALAALHCQNRGDRPATT